MLPCWQTLLASASAWFMTSALNEITPTQRPGKSFLLVPSRDEDGILWLKLLLGCKQSQCSRPCENCWVIQIPSCGRKRASGTAASETDGLLWDASQWDSEGSHFSRWEAILFSERSTLSLVALGYKTILLRGRQGWESQPLPQRRLLLV